jgi:broad specificity phosphatase PhoE
LLKLIVMRHGLTLENIEHIMQGQTEGTLSEEGIKQAKEAGIILSKQKIDAIFSSDLARTRDTAKEVTKFHNGFPVSFVKEIREMHWGEYQGKKIENGVNIWELKVKGRETTEDFQKRVGGFIKQLAQDYQGKTVLLVTHSGVCRALINYLEKRGHEEINKTEGLKNAEIMVLNIDKDLNFKRSEL